MRSEYYFVSTCIPIKNKKINQEIKQRHIRGDKVFNWIRLDLQVFIDGFLPEISIFSFITTVVTSTQGNFFFSAMSLLHRS
jgi:hypothetical protein